MVEAGAEFENPLDRYQFLLPKNAPKDFGFGGSGKVHYATRVVDGQPVVIKKYPLNELLKYYSKISDELDKWLSLIHPHNLVFFEYFSYGDTFYLVSEYVQGINLRQKIDACKKSGIHLPEQLIINVFAQLLSSIKNLNDVEVNHAVIKPENIMLMEGTNNIKFIGFNIFQSLNQITNKPVQILITS